MGYWTNLWDALLGRKPAVCTVVPVYTRVVPVTDTNELATTNVQVPPITTPITRKKKAPTPKLVDKTPIEWSLDQFKNLNQLERQSIGKTYDTLTASHRDIGRICALNIKQAKYVTKAYATDKKWASAVELSQYVSNEDVQMLYFLYSQCNDLKIVAMLFGIDEKIVQSYFDKMDSAQMKSAKRFTKFPPNTRNIRFNTYVKCLSISQLKNMLRIFRKVKRVSALRYVLPMYSKVIGGQMSQKMFLLWSYCAAEEEKREAIK